MKISCHMRKKGEEAGGCEGKIYKKKKKYTIARATWENGLEWNDRGRTDGRSVGRSAISVPSVFQSIMGDLIGRDSLFSLSLSREVPLPSRAQIFF